MPGTFNSTNPVSVGLSTKADHYNRAFNNGLACYAGEMAITGQAAFDDIYASSATQLARGARQLRQTFRGLVLRTHPDADLEASQILLDKCDEMVFNDGTRVANLANLVADITVSGAGGLAAGAEGASRHYQAYVLRKSSDGTLCLVLHRAKDWTSDVSFTTARDASRALRLATSTATDNLAQGVQFATSKPFVFFNAELVRVGTVTGRVWFTLESDTAGSPSGTVLATSKKLNAARVNTSNGHIIRIPFRAPATPTATTQYHLRMWGDYTRSDANYIAWRGVAAGGYAGGSAKQFNGAAWSAASGVGDFYFNCFTEQNDTPLTLPGGYDQYCLVHPGVYNDSSSNFVPFEARDRRIRFFQGQHASTTTATIPTLVDLSAVIPPVPVDLDVGAEASATSIVMAVAGVPDGFGTPSDSVEGFGMVVGYDGVGAAGYPTGRGSVMTDHQACYVRVNGSTGVAFVMGYAW